MFLCYKLYSRKQKCFYGGQCLKQRNVLLHSPFCNNEWNRARVTRNWQVCAVTVVTHVSDCASADIQVVLIFDHCNKAVTCGSQSDHIHYHSLSVAMQKHDSCSSAWPQVNI